MTEAQLSTLLQKYAPGAHWQRIENSVGVGLPDLNVCWMGKEFWFELKIDGGARTRSAQTVWHIKRRSVGGRCYRLSYNPKNKLLTVSAVDKDHIWEKLDSFVLSQANFSCFLAAL